METDPLRWLAALRGSHDRLEALVAPLDGVGLRRQSYARDWTIAQVLSHIGSQSEIFGMFLDVSLAGSEPPGAERFPPIWDEWNARSPEDQATAALAASEKFVARIEAMDAVERDGVQMSIFGMDVDLAGLLQMRLSEHAVHTWDVAVALDERAQIAPDAVDLVVDALGLITHYVGRPLPVPVVEVRTTAPDRRFRLESGPEKLALTDGATGEPAASVTLPAASATLPAASATLPAEAFVRLVYGRLDPAHTPPVDTDGVSLDDLRAAFPGV